MVKLKIYLFNHKISKHMGGICNKSKIWWTEL